MDKLINRHFIRPPSFSGHQFNPDSRITLQHKCLGGYPRLSRHFVGQLNAVLGQDSHGGSFHLEHSKYLSQAKAGSFTRIEILIYHAI